MAQTDPFDEAYIRANLSYAHLPQANNSGPNSADASVAANESATSLIDPMLDAQIDRQKEQELHECEDNATLHKSTNPPNPSYDVRQPGQKAMKTVAPIRVPRRSEASGHDGMRSARSGMSSAALTSSFPMPPPRTPGGSISGGSGSPAVSLHAQSHRASPSNEGYTGSSTPKSASQRHSPELQMPLPLPVPRKVLSVPPPTPASFNARASSSLGLYWEGEVSSVRNSGSCPGPTSTAVPYYSPDPAAQQYTPAQAVQYARHRSFAAELSTPLPSMPASPAYPPRAYSPIGSDTSPYERQHLPSSPSHDGSHIHSPSGRASRPLLYRHHSERPADLHHARKRRGSSGTFGTMLSNPTLGVNELENDEHASNGSRTRSHSRSHSEVSIASSPGMTHELVRAGNVFEARPSNAVLQEASRRLARASLVSSELLRTKASADALRATLAEDNDDDPYEKMERRHSSMMLDPERSSAPLDYVRAKRQSRRRGGNKRPDYTVRQYSNWASKSTKSYISHNSGKSSANFTVASHAPDLPSLHAPNARSEIAGKESALPFRKLAKRASTLGDILDNMPDHKPYISHASAGGRDPSYDELRELQYSNQLRKARRKIEVGVPNMWNSHTPMGSVSSGLQGHSSDTDEKSELYPSTSTYHVRSPRGVDERHFRRRKSYPASQLREAMSMYTEKPAMVNMRDRSSFSSAGTREDEPSQPPHKPTSWWHALPPQKKKRLRLALILLIGLLIAALIGAVVPLTKKSARAGAECARSCLNGGRPVLQDDQCTCHCTGDWAGPFCDLDTTCACPDDSEACSYRLARSLLSAASYASTLFAPSVNTTRLAALYAGIEGPSSDGCSVQTRLLVTPNLDPVQYRTRRRWTQAVFLWDAATTEDVESTRLRDYQSSLSYWQWQDSPSFQAQPSFQIQNAGYTIDFAYQRVFVAPKTLDELGISQSIAVRLSNSSASAMQRIGAYAVAASAHRTAALVRLFENLGYTEDQLVDFRNIILASPVYFPFNVTASIGSQPSLAVGFRQKDAGSGFPLPLACLPGLSESQLVKVNRVEEQIFGLNPVAAQADASENCTDRPTYGLLNILNLRLPFLDAERPNQAAVITNQDRRSRLTMSTGENLIPLAFGVDTGTEEISTASFGTIRALDNVLFDYLVKLSDAPLAKAFIEYILARSDLPPAQSSELWTLSSGLQALPAIKVQLWGPLLFSDIDYIVSGISRPDGNALFGSQLGAQLRDWGRSGSNGKPIRWSADATSERFATDDGSNGAFQAVWDSSGSSSATDVLANLDNSNLLNS